jgi:hypothetical protein
MSFDIHIKLLGLYNKGVDTGVKHSTGFLFFNEQPGSVLMNQTRYQCLIGEPLLNSFSLDGNEIVLRKTDVYALVFF